MAAEKRLIDANPIIESYSGGEEVKSMAECIHDERFVSVLKNAPEVDAVEVVRCEECVHCYQLKVDENGFWQEVEKGGTHNLCRRNEETFDVRCDDFCSYGERKMVNLEDIVDLDAQTAKNNEAMRKVIDFMVGERSEGE